MTQEVQEALNTVAVRLVSKDEDYVETLVVCEDGSKYRIWVRVQKVV